MYAEKTNMFKGIHVIRGGGGMQRDYGFICAVRTSFQNSFQYAFLLKTTSIGQKFKMVDLKKSDFDNIFQIFY